MIFPDRRAKILSARIQIILITFLKLGKLRICVEKYQHVPLVECLTRFPDLYQNFTIAWKNFKDCVFFSIKKPRTELCIQVQYFETRNISSPQTRYLVKNNVYNVLILPIYPCWIFSVRPQCLLACSNCSYLTGFFRLL